MRGSQCRSRDVNFLESVALRQRVYYKIIWNLTTELVMWKNPDEGLTFEKSALEFLYDVHWIQSLTRLIQRNVIGLFPQVHVRTIYAETRKQSKTAPDPITEAEDTKNKGLLYKVSRTERDWNKNSLNCFLCSEWKWWPARLRKYMCNLLSSPDTNKATRRE